MRIYCDSKLTGNKISQLLPNDIPGGIYRYPLFNMKNATVIFTYKMYDEKCGFLSIQDQIPTGFQKKSIDEFINIIYGEMISGINMIGDSKKLLKFLINKIKTDDTL